MNDLIIVKQLPIIEERLRSLSEEIDRKVAEAQSLVCTEDSVKEVKKVRAELNKLYAELEEQRKAVKAAVLDPYNAFETIYKECVAVKFKTADNDLKRKIGEVEDGVKAEKAGELLAYFAEYAQSLHLDWLPFESAGINVTLSASMKSLKEQIKAFADRVSNEVGLIETQEYKDEIMVEYKRCLSVSKAVTAVVARHRAIEEQRRRAEEAAPVIQAEQEAAKAVESFAPPKVVETPPVETAQDNDPIVRVTFTVTEQMSKCKALKKFLDDGGYHYE